MWALVAMIFDYIPIQTYVGAEITNWYLGRLQIAPTLVVGAGGLFPLEEEHDEGFLVITHFGGKAFLSLSYLVSRDVKLTVEPGFSLWFGLADEALGDLIDVARTYYGPSFSLAGGVQNVRNICRRSEYEKCQGAVGTSSLCASG